MALKDIEAELASGISEPPQVATHETVILDDACSDEPPSSPAV